MHVIFIYGPAAAGKFTVGQHLSDRLDWPLFHNHLVVDAVKSLFAFGTPGFVALRAKMWTDAFVEAAKQGQSFVFTFNPENTVDPGLLKTLEGVITAANGQVHYVELQCDDAVLCERMNLPSRQQFGKLTDVALYQSLKAAGSFEFPHFCDPLLCVDTTTQDAKRSAEVIHSALSAFI